MSWQASVLTRALRMIEKPALARAADPVDVRASFERKARLLFHAPRGTTRHALDFGGLEVSGPWALPERCIIFFHGGAYMFGSPNTHFAMAGQMSKRTKAKVVLPKYPLAPEDPFPASIHAARSAYDTLTQANPNAILGGDSAGGGLAFSVLATLLQDNAPLPKGVFAFSPLTDLTFSAKSLTENAEQEAILPVSRVKEMADLYLGDADPRDPRASPVFAHFAGAPPVWLTVDDTEILRDDCVRLRDLMVEHGVPVTLEVTSGLPHDWPIFHNVLPEARTTLDQLAGWAKALWSETAES